ncbi:amino acid transporter AVT1A-like [Spinacia oleracea]|uniref:Amino acid transporter AVT1A-like n=1 Tax=Spinacia oleracea TaxID=3562 RepID=A0A9R0JUC1_SPIOL|nr:amino acid transporter AVT1A-like [Spinacia oleracea]
MGGDFSDFIFKVDDESDNDEIIDIIDDHEDSSSINDGESISRTHYGSSVVADGSRVVADGHSYSEQWPRSYKETTDSLSIAASPNGINFLKQAQNITQNITQSITNITSSHQDLGAKAPLLTPNDKSKEQFDKLSSTLTWSTIGKSSFFHTSGEQITHGCNVTQTVFNGFSLFVGIGLLSVPSTIQQGGWASVGLLLLYAGICYFTGYLLRRCMEINKDIVTFPDLGEAAFGNFGRVFVSILFYWELYFSLVEFVTLESSNLAKLFPNVSLQWGGIYLGPVYSLGIISALIVLPICYLRDFRKISFISAGGVLGVVCIALSLLLVGTTTENIGFHQTGPLVKWNGLPYAFGVFGFCYSGHSILPNLYHSMSDKKKFHKALTIIFALSISVYLLVAISGFLMFGEDTDSQITLNLPANSVATTITLWMTVLSPFFKYPLLLNPLARSLEELLPPHLSNNWWCIIPLRTALVVSSVCVAFLVPFFGYVMAFVGSLVCLLASIVVPALGYVKIAKNLSSIQIIMCYAVAVMGLTVAVLGTYSSIYNIIHSY